MRHRLMGFEMWGVVIVAVQTLMVRLAGAACVAVGRGSGRRLGGGRCALAADALEALRHSRYASC